jgi:hypothetical protein
MTIIDTLRTYIRGRTPTAQLAEIREQIAEASTEVQRIEGEIARRAMAVMTGDQGAIRLCGELAGQKAEIAARITIMRVAEADRIRVVAEESEAERQKAARELPVRLADLAERSLGLDDTIQELGTGLATSIKDKLAIDEEIARLSGSGVFHRTRERAGEMIRNALEPLFRIDPARPSAVNNNHLTLVTGLYGGQAGRSLRDLDQPCFDDLIPYFQSEAAAHKAQARLADRSTSTTIKQIGEVWMLIRHDELFVDQVEAHRAVAAAARRGVNLTVVEHRPGYRVCAAAFADSAIMHTAGA